MNISNTTCRKESNKLSLTGPLKTLNILAKMYKAKEYYLTIIGMNGRGLITWTRSEPFIVPKPQNLVDSFEIKSLNSIPRLNRALKDQVLKITL